MDHYFTIEKPSQAEFKDRGSRFIAYAFPISDTTDFKKKLQKIKREHGKATHHCFAYRIGIRGDIFKISDDGEPPGTAGKPIGADRFKGFGQHSNYCSPLFWRQFINGSQVWSTLTRRCQPIHSNSPP